MHVFETKHLALKAATLILPDRAAEVQVGPMLDTREGVLKRAELRRVMGKLSTEVHGANTTAAAHRRPRVKLWLTHRRRSRSIVK